MYTHRGGHQRWRRRSGDNGHRGDALDLVVAVKGLPCRDALDWLATRAGHALESGTVHRPAPWGEQPATVGLDPAVVTYTQCCAQILWTPHGRLYGNGCTTAASATTCCV